MSDDTIKPLTSEERAWIRSLDRLFKRMPKRLLLVECADGLMVVDRDAAAHTDMEDGGATRAGIVLEALPSAACKVTSVSG